MSQQVSGRRRRREDEFSPGELFANGEQGAWYDPSDFATLYQDSAGTTPVTALGQPVGLMLDKANWDGRGVVNLLTQTEAFDQSPWGLSSSGTGVNPVVTANASVAPDGTTTADKVELDVGAGVTTSDRSVISQNFTVSTQAYTFSLWAKGDTGGEEILIRNAANAYTKIVLTTQWQRFSFTANGSGSAVSFEITLRQGLSGIGTINATATVYLWGAQLELGSTATAYQPNGAGVGGPGNHAAQATTAAMPYVQARKNLLRLTENFNSWTKIGGGTGSAPTVTADATTAPDGTLTADRAEFDLGGGTTSSDRSILRFGPVDFVAGQDYTLSVWMKSADGNPYDVEIVIVSSYSKPTVTTDWVRYSTTFTSSTTGASYVYVRVFGSLSVNDADVYLWGAQLEVGSTATTYQRVTTATDYADIGLPRYLEFDGVDDAMATQSVDFTSTDEMTVCAGIRKDADAIQVIAELGPAAGANDGSFHLISRTSPANSAQMASRGTVTSSAYAFVGSPPILLVLTGLADISDDIVTLRSNAVQIDSASSNQGTGNYRNDVLNIGARDEGATQWFDGRIHQLIIRGATTAGALLDQTERFVARKTGVAELAPYRQGSFSWDSSTSSPGAA